MPGQSNWTGCIERFKSNNIYVVEHNFVIYRKIIWKIDINEFKENSMKWDINTKLCFHKDLDIDLSLKNCNPRQIKIKTFVFKENQVCDDFCSCCEEERDEDDICVCDLLYQCSLDKESKHNKSYDSISKRYNSDTEGLCECCKDSIVLTADCYIKSNDDKDYKLILNKTYQEFDIEYFTSYMLEELTVPDNDFSIMIDLKLNFEIKRRIIVNPFEKYLGDKSFIDFAIICSDGIKVFANRMVLALCSPILKTIMNVPEKKFEIALNGINSKTMQEFVRFAYCSKVNDLDKIVESLLYAAHKFQVKDLKNLCIDHLSKNLRKDNVFETLTIAESYNLKFLIHQCIGFIIKSYETDEKHFENLSSKVRSKIVDMKSSIYHT